MKRKQKEEDEDEEEVNLFSTQIRFESKTEIEVQYYDYGSIWRNLRVWCVPNTHAYSVLFKLSF